MSVNIYENGSLKGIAGVSLAPENIFTGTKQEYDIAYADGKIKDGMIINITDDYETINPIGKDNILGTMEQISANTDEDKLAGATAVKELGEEVSELNNNLMKYVSVSSNGFTCNISKSNSIVIMVIDVDSVTNGARVSSLIPNEYRPTNTRDNIVVYQGATAGDACYIKVYNNGTVGADCLTINQQIKHAQSTFIYSTN